jgi:hypothetical protein
MSFEQHYKLFIKIYKNHRSQHNHRRCETQLAKDYGTLYGCLRDRTNLSPKGIADLICDLRRIVIAIKSCRRDHVPQDDTRRKCTPRGWYKDCVKFLANTESYIVQD